MKRKFLIGLLSSFLVLSGAIVASAKSSSKGEAEHKMDDRSSSSLNHDKYDDSKNRIRAKHHDDGPNHDKNDDSKLRKSDGKHKKLHKHKHKHGNERK